jgi:inner membrane protein
LDNICHSLVGGALSRAGFDRRTPLATATMIIGANFPDIDVIAVPFGTDIGWRRGVTHGWPAHIILPFVLTGIMLAWDRWWRRRTDPSLAPAVPREILLLSAISIATHPFMDWLNSYGMRWLMPFRNEWFYGDSLFIVDLFLWLTLFLGFFFAGRRKSPRPARIAVSLSAVYIAMMMAVTVVGRDRVARDVGRTGLTRRELMVAPVPVNPFSRQVILAEPGRYRTGTWSLFNGITWADTIAIDDDSPAVAIARRDPALRSFMHWTRFPFFIVRYGDNGTAAVDIADARYTGAEGGGWASRAVVVHP